MAREFSLFARSVVNGFFGSLKHLSDYLQTLVRGRLWLKVLIGMVLGLVVGVAIGPSTGWVKPEIAYPLSSWLALPGHLFLALIQMIVIPLVFASIIRGLAASENLDQLRQLGIRVVLYFTCTTTVAILIGILVAELIEPGAYIDKRVFQAALAAAPPSPSGAPVPLDWAELPQKVLTLLPANPLTSMVENDMLRIVVFSIVVGVALVTTAPQTAKPLLDLLGSLQEICLTIVRWAMMLAPFAVFGLIAQLIRRCPRPLLLFFNNMSRG